VAAENTSKGEAFRSQFIGMSGVLAVDKDGGEVDSISSATITSRAITNGVNAALKCAENLVKEG
jgi:electron transport complex protein RnfG